MRNYHFLTAQLSSYCPNTVNNTFRTSNWEIENIRKIIKSRFFCFATSRSDAQTSFRCKIRSITDRTNLSNSEKECLFPCSLLAYIFIHVGCPPIAVCLHFQSFKFTSYSLHIRSSRPALVFHCHDLLLSIQFYSQKHVEVSFQFKSVKTARKETHFKVVFVTIAKRSERKKSKTHKFIIYRYLILFSYKSTLEAILMLFHWTISFLLRLSPPSLYLTLLGDVGSKNEDNLRDFPSTD